MFWCLKTQKILSWAGKLKHFNHLCSFFWVSLLKDHQETSSASCDRENWGAPDFWTLSASRSHVSQRLVFNTPNGIRPLSGYMKSLVTRFPTDSPGRMAPKFASTPTRSGLKSCCARCKWFCLTLNEKDSISLCTQFWVMNSFIALQRRGEDQFHHRSRQILISYLGLLSLWAGVHPGAVLGALLLIYL